MRRKYYSLSLMPLARDVELSDDYSSQYIENFKRLKGLAETYTINCPLAFNPDIRWKGLTEKESIS